MSQTDGLDYTSISKWVKNPHLNGVYSSRVREFLDKHGIPLASTRPAHTQQCATAIKNSGVKNFRLNIWTKIKNVAIFMLNEAGVVGNTFCLTL